MSRSFEPNERPILSTIYGPREADKTNAEITLAPLTDEVLRDIARNESVQRSWRKAAIKFLIQRNHKYQHFYEFRELKDEIADESVAEKEVQALVESAIEGPLDE